MIPKVIKTDEQYQKSLARLEELMDAKPCTPESDELESLGALIEQYEQEKYPIDPPDHD